MSKVTKYLVADQRLRWINDIDAIYGGSDRVKLGVIEKLLATNGEYLQEESAVAGSFQESLRSGLLKSYIEKGMIKVVQVEEKERANADVFDANPYAQKDSLKSMIDEIKIGPKVDTTPPESPKNWDNLSFEEKKKLMVIEEQKEAERKRQSEESQSVRDWNKMTRAEKEEAMEEFRKQNTPKPKKEKRLISKKTEKTVENAILGKVKVVKGQKVKKGQIVQGVESEEGRTTICSVTASPDAVGDTIGQEKEALTFNEFDSLKYQDKLVFISKTMDVVLLGEIMQKSQSDMILVRAMKRKAVLDKK